MDFLGLYHLQLRGSSNCEINIHSTKLNMIVLLITDIALLLIMLIGLLRLGFNEPGVYELGHLMWRQVGCTLFSQVVMLQFADMLTVGQGLIWLFLATIAEVPPVVCVASPMYPPLLLIVAS